MNTTSVPDLEHGESSSGFQNTVGLLVFVSVGGLIGFLSLYLLYLSGKMQWFPGVPPTSAGGTASSPMNRSVNGVNGLMTIYLPLFSAILVAFSLASRLPTILGNEESRERLRNLLWHGVIPVGTVMFFVLLVFRFLGGRMFGYEWMGTSTMVFLAVVAGVMLVGVIANALFKPTRQQETA